MGSMEKDMTDETIEEMERRHQALEQALLDTQYDEWQAAFGDKLLSDPAVHAASTEMGEKHTKSLQALRHSHGNEYRAAIKAGKGKKPEEDTLTPGPLQPGFYSPDELYERVVRLHEDICLGATNLCSTGFASVDELVKIRKGELYIVTGIPGHGKSEVVDQFAMNLASNHLFKVALCSLENLPIERHIGKLIEKALGKAFFSRRHPLDPGHIGGATMMLNNSFRFFHPGDANITPDVILRQAVALSQQWGGLDMLVVDPWNELEHSRGGRYDKLSDTDYLSKCLSQFRRFARNNNVATFIVAHPTKLLKKDDGSFPVPTMYDINGGAMWRNKADVGLCVYRDLREEGDSNLVQIHVQKVRFKEVGKLGMVELVYERRNGKFSEKEKEGGDGQDELIGV